MAAGVDVRVVGVGGAGGNALRHLREGGVDEGVSLIAVNTDRQALEELDVRRQVVLGMRATRGLGAGGRPSVGFAAAQEQAAAIQRAVAGADLVFVAAGMGGGTGTGAAPLVAHLAHEAGALVVGVVTTPFAFEGAFRGGVARDGLAALKDQVDALLTIENDRLMVDDLTLGEAFRYADTVLASGVRGVGDLVTQTGHINLDFADVEAVLRDGGRAVMGLGHGRGPKRASIAVEQASISELLSDDSIDGARGVLLSFTVDPALGLNAIHEAAARVQAAVDDDADILFGVSVCPDLVDECYVTLVAAGLDDALAAPEPAPEAARRRNALVMLEPTPVRARALG